MKKRTAFLASLAFVCSAAMPCRGQTPVAASIPPSEAIRLKVKSMHEALYGLAGAPELRPPPAILDMGRPKPWSPAFWRGRLAGSPVPEVGLSGLFPIREAGEAEIGILSTGEDSLEARLQTLMNAKRSVRIQALIFTGDESGRAIMRILKEKKKAGLDVRVIVDAFSNILTSKGAMDLATQMMYFDLKESGIEVEGYEALLLQWMNEISFRDPKQPCKRFHDKMWIIDAEEPAEAVAIVGGMNIANEYFRTRPDAAYRWRDQDFIVKGAVVSDVAAAFDRNYADQKAIKNSRPWLLNTDKAWKLWRKHFDATVERLGIKFPTNAAALAKVQDIQARAGQRRFPTAPAKVRFLQSRPRYEESYILQAYEDLFASARQELLVVNAYFIPGERILEGLKDAARQGANVTVITNSAATNDLPQMAYASRYVYKELLAVNADPAAIENGGRLAIAEWNGHKFGEGTLHAKFAVADRRFVIGGSYNLDLRSENLNSETVIQFESEALGSELASRIIGEDLRKCEFITQEAAEEFHNPKNPPDMLQLLFWNGIKGEL
ncbi:MAG: phosphatidylserine/phosphatidylglycerophosphate/cardiolipin synthase family protein [Elusimicrobia bacterium]|nr:phosphatidylserine/phosphatidylglycerophosphate/cardiolipin synthase family protein [Elusimicrobiota bacterium]